MPPGAVGRGAERGGGAMVVEKRSKKASAEGGGVIGSRQRLSSMASLPSLDRASFLALRKGVARALWRSYQGRDALGVAGSLGAGPQRRELRRGEFGGFREQAAAAEKVNREGSVPLSSVPVASFPPAASAIKNTSYLSPPPPLRVPFRCGDVDRPTASGFTLCGCG